MRAYVCIHRHIHVCGHLPAAVPGRGRQGAADTAEPRAGASRAPGPGRAGRGAVRPLPPPLPAVFVFGRGPPAGLSAETKGLWGTLGKIWVSKSWIPVKEKLAVFPHPILLAWARELILLKIFLQLGSSKTIFLEIIIAGLGRFSHYFPGGKQWDNAGEAEGCLIVTQTQKRLWGSYELLGKYLLLIQKRDFNTEQVMDTQIGAGYTVECIFCGLWVEFSNRSTFSSLMFLWILFNVTRDGVLGPQMAAKGKFAHLLSVGAFTSNLLICLPTSSGWGQPPGDLNNCKEVTSSKSKT